MDKVKVVRRKFSPLMRHEFEFDLPENVDYEKFKDGVCKYMQDNWDACNITFDDEEGYEEGK